MTDPADHSEDATTIDGMMEHLEEAKKLDKSDSSRKRQRWSGLRRKVRKHRNVAVLSKHYTDRLDELVKSEAITHRSSKTWKSAEAAIDAHGELPIYYRADDLVTHKGVITALITEPDPSSDDVEKFREHISDNDSYGEFNKEFDNTTYIVEYGTELQDPFPMTELRKVSDNQPIDENYWRSPAYVFHRDGDFDYSK